MKMDERSLLVEHGTPDVIELTRIEMHVAHSCNLTCESCSHFSNHGHKGLTDLEEAERWMASWAPRIAPNEFSLMGGEPAIHPDFPKFLPLVRRHWPNARIRLVSNGFLLARHPDLPLRMEEVGNARLYISIHHDSPSYTDRLRPTMAMLDDWRIKYDIWIGTYQSARNWTRRYHGHGSTLRPYTDARPEQSWEKCPARFCMQLFEGALWKCPPLAYLRMQHEKYRLDEIWAPYLAYRALQPDFSDAELEAFLARKAEKFCGMCPAEPERFNLPVPIRSGRGCEAS
jgi:hypothetical protein